MSTPYILICVIDISVAHSHFTSLTFNISGINLAGKNFACSFSFDILDEACLTDVSAFGNCLVQEICHRRF
jgi:hypothetical protein